MNGDLSDSQDEYHYYNSYENSLPYHTPQYEYFDQIIPSVFFISAVCVGLPCLIWAFYSVHRQKKAKGRNSAFIILLLLSDLLQLLLYPYIVTQVLTDASDFDPDLFSIEAPIGLKLCGLHLQQLVALEGVLTLKYPTISNRMFSCPCYIMISIIILLIPVISVVFLAFGGLGFQPIFLAFGSILAPVCLLVVTGMIVYKTPPITASTPVTHRPGAKVFTLSLITLLVLYLPCVLLFFLLIVLEFPHISESWFMMTVCLISLTVISEPLLCVLVCRENLSTETQHTQIELNAEDTPV